MIFFRDDLGFYCFQRMETTRSKENTSNSKHATTQESSNIFQYSMGWHNFADVLSKALLLLWHLSLNRPKKTETFLWTKECQKAWELIKQKYIETPILISPNQQVEFHAHIYASLLAVGAMLSQDVTGKRNQPIMYASRLLNKVEQNYSTIERELQQWFLFCTSLDIICWAVNLSFMYIMALVYLINKPQV